MKKMHAIAAGGLVGLLTATTAGTAEAATYKLNNIKVSYAQGGVKVGWCSGGNSLLRTGQSTTKDVCSIWFPYNTELFAYVKETGTVLIDTANCGNTRWQRFTSRTDTSRTAVIIYMRANCV